MQETTKERPQETIGLIRYTVCMANNPCKYHSWYHQNWNTDPFVVESDYETLGVYVLLLHRQMAVGNIPSNIDRLVRQIGHQITKEKFLEIWEERGLKYQFKEVKRTWESKSPPSSRPSDPKVDGVWKDLPEPLLDRDGSPLLYHEFLHQVMENDRRITQGRSRGGENAQSNRVTAAGLEVPPEETPSFDFRPIIRVMPKRMLKGKKGWDGWDGGVDLLKFITTQEEYDELCAATAAYAKERKGKDAEYHISFRKWVQGEYRNHLPSQKSVSAPVAPATPEPEVLYATTDEKIKALRAKGETIQTPPWVPRATTADPQKLIADWTEEDRASWLTKYLEDPNA